MECLDGVVILIIVDWVGMGFWLGDEILENLDSNKEENDLVVLPLVPDLVVEER